MDAKKFLKPFFSSMLPTLLVKERHTRKCFGNLFQLFVQRFHHHIITYALLSDCIVSSKWEYYCRHSTGVRKSVISCSNRSFCVMLSCPLPPTDTTPVCVFSITIDALRLENKKGKRARKHKNE